MLKIFFQNRTSKIPSVRCRCPRLRAVFIWPEYSALFSFHRLIWRCYVSKCLADFWEEGFCEIARGGAGAPAPDPTKRLTTTARTRRNRNSRTARLTNTDSAAGTNPRRSKPTSARQRAAQPTPGRTATDPETARRATTTSDTRRRQHNKRPPFFFCRRQTRKKKKLGESAPHERPRGSAMLPAVFVIGCFITKTKGCQGYKGEQKKNCFPAVVCRQRIVFLHH